MFFDKIYGSWKEIQFSKYEKMLEILPGLRGKQILDIGIGTGYFESFLQKKGIKANIVGIDTGKEIIPGKNARADGNELPFIDESFDMIICLDTMHLINSSDFRRVLKPNGIVLFSIFFNKQNLEEKRATLRSRLAGFKILKELELEDKENEYFVLAKKK